jgi:hypothetical protein
MRLRHNKLLLCDVGQKFCVLLGSNPEEVQQWLNERKKNFPTRGNIERKKREQEELAAAG